MWQMTTWSTKLSKNYPPLRPSVSTPMTTFALAATKCPGWCFCWCKMFLHFHVLHWCCLVTVASPTATDGSQMYFLQPLWKHFCWLETVCLAKQETLVPNEGSALKLHRCFNYEICWGGGVAHLNMTNHFFSVRIKWKCAQSRPDHIFVNIFIVFISV